ncbi:TPA: hypothetical protein OMI82_004821 [Escherichia coli]|nr:hypothetical protein [Escherichia coli]
MSDIYKLTYRLEPGKVDKELLAILIDISPIRSDKLITALGEYYIHGEKRKLICDKYKINQGYFSLKIREIQDLNFRIYNLFPFYIDKLIPFQGR